MVDHAQNEYMVFPLHVENPKRKLMEIGAADVLVNDGKTLGMGSNQKENAIQIVPKREVQAVSFLGVPALGRQDVPLRR